MNNLERLIRPKSIAVVGGNDKMGSFGNFSMKNVMQNKGNVRYYVVNSRNETVCGLRAYKTLSDPPEVPDCIMICTPKSTVPELLTEAGELGVGAAIIVASGYDEDGTESGRRDAEKLGMIAEKYRMKVMGPNCTGFINNIDKIKLWGMGGTDFDMETRRTGVATFANSGTMALHSIGCPYLRISYAFSMGNCTYLSIEEVLEYILEDENVHVIGIYFEGTKDPARLLKCFARAEELDKPIVVHAAGISKKGAAAASSHTGNLASSKAVYEALFKKYGVIMVENTDEYLCALDALSIWHRTYA